MEEEDGSRRRRFDEREGTRDPRREMTTRTNRTDATTTSTTSTTSRRADARRAIFSPRARRTSSLRRRCPSSLSATPFSALESPTRRRRSVEVEREGASEAESRGVGVERRERRAGGRRETSAPRVMKVLKDRRSPRERGRTGTSVNRTRLDELRIRDVRHHELPQLRDRVLHRV